MPWLNNGGECNEEAGNDDDDDYNDDDNDCNDDDNDCNDNDADVVDMLTSVSSPPANHRLTFLSHPNCNIELHCFVYDCIFLHWKCITLHHMHYIWNMVTHPAKNII